MIFIKKKIYLILCCCVAIEATAQSAFQKQLVGMGKFTLSLSQTADGGYLVGGDEAETGRCARVARLDRWGEPLWGSQVCFEAADDFFGTALDHAVEAPDGSIRVVFHKNRPQGKQDVFAASLDPQGNPLWTRKLSDIGKNTAGWWPALSIDALGNMWFVSGDRIWYSGWTTSNTSDFDLYKISPDGSKVEVKRFQISKENRYDVRGVYAPTPNDVFVYGIVYQNSFSGVHDGFLMKFNGQGALQWRKVWRGIHFQRIESDFANGDLMAVGRSDNFNTAIARIGRDGQMVWAKTVQVGRNQYYAPYQAKISADKRRIFLAADLGRGIADSAAVYCFDEQARFLWGVGYGLCKILPYNRQSVATADGGFALLQHDEQKILLLKADSTGKPPDGCPYGRYTLPPPRDLTLSEDAYEVTFETPPPPADEPVRWSRFAPKAQDYCAGEFPFADMAMPDTVCAGQLVGVAHTGNANYDALDWSFPGGLPDVSYKVRPDSVFFQKTGSLVVRLVQTHGSCRDTALHPLTVLGPRNPVAFVDTVLCPGQNLVVRVDAPSATIRWGDGSRDGVRTLIKPGLYAVTVSEAGCVTPDSFRVRARTSNFLPLDTFICKNGRLNPHYGGPSFVWRWNGQAAEPPFVPDSTRETQTLEVLFPDGCMVSNPVRVQYIPCERPYFPNAFAPDSDGENAVFTAYGPGFSPVASAVYTRWGEICYRGEKNQWPRWDGTWSGKKAPPGVYIWTCTLESADGQRHHLKGEITLIR